MSGVVRHAEQTRVGWQLTRRSGAGNGHHGHELGRAAFVPCEDLHAEVQGRAGTSAIKPRQARERSDESEAGEGSPGRRVLLGDAGPDPQASRGCLDAGGLQRRRRRQRHLLEPRDPRRGDRDRLRPRGDLLPRIARVLLPDPRPDDVEPPGQRPRRELPLGDLLPRRGAAPGRRGHHRRRRGLWAVARQGRHRGHPGGSVLGGRAGAPGLPGALPERLHLPLPAPGLVLPHRSAAAR